MKRALILASMALITGLFASGCANNRAIIVKASLGNRGDVFTEVPGKEVQPGKATADIKFTVKSNSSRFMWIYNKHTDPPYRVHLNIDGQTTILAAEPILEVKDPVDSNVPESGTGWKYHFSKRIAIASGKHKLIIALPIDDVIVEREIELHSGINTVAVVPVYKKKSLRPYKGQNFTAGVRTLEVTVH